MLGEHTGENQSGGADTGQPPGEAWEWAPGRAGTEGARAPRTPRRDPEQRACPGGLCECPLVKHFLTARWLEPGLQFPPCPAPCKHDPHHLWDPSSGFQGSPSALGLSHSLLAGRAVLGAMWSGLIQRINWMRSIWGGCHTVTDWKEPPTCTELSRS